MNVICDHTGEALFCYVCQHGKEHYPLPINKDDDCKTPSICQVIDKEVRCVEKHFEIIGKV